MQGESIEDNMIEWINDATVIRVFSYYRQKTSIIGEFIVQSNKDEKEFDTKKFREIKALAESMASLYRQAFLVYKPIVDDLCSGRKVESKELENVLDGLVSMCMSYDIYLKDPVTKKTAEVPGHLMRGGTFMANYHPESGTFTPALNTEAWLNITYNYGHYYYEVNKEEGIRGIYGKTGLDSIPILEGMITFIEKIPPTRKEDIEFEVSEGDTSDCGLRTWAPNVKLFTFHVVKRYISRRRCINRIQI